MNPSQDLLGERDVKGRLMNLFVRLLERLLLVSKTHTTEIGHSIIPGDCQHWKNKPDKS